MTVARIDGTDGTPIAAIVGYACHPITLAFQNRLLSPDYPGVVRSVVEGLTGATCLFLQGCAGDQMPIEGLTGDTSVHRRLARGSGPRPPDVSRDRSRGPPLGVRPGRRIRGAARAPASRGRAAGA